MASAQHSNFWRLRVFLTLLFAFLLTACGGGGSGTSATDNGSNSSSTSIATDNNSSNGSTTTTTPPSDTGGTSGTPDAGSGGNSDTNTGSTDNTSGSGDTVTNHAPAALPVSSTVTRNNNVNINLNAIDIDGDKLTYSIVTQPTHGTLSGISTTGTVTYTPSSGYTGSDSFEYKVSDGKLESATAKVTLTVKAPSGSGGSGGGTSPPPPANVAPTANAGADQTVDEKTVVALDGSVSADSDGLIAGYAWVQTAGTAATLSSASVAQPTFTAPDVAADETLTFELTVTDDKGATAKDSVNVALKNVIAPPPANVAPTANAGADQTVDEKTVVALDGSVSADSDGSIASYAWVQTAGTAATLSSVSVAQPTFTAPDVAADETLTFELTVTDDKGATAKDSVAISLKHIVVGLRGRFVDSPVAGLPYKTDTRAGVTDADGYFYYDIPGESVYFSLSSNLDLGVAQAAPNIHVYDLNEMLAEAGLGKNGRIAQLLQSLDTDGNAENNIQLPNDLEQKFDRSFNLNFSQPQAEFDTTLKKKLTDWELANYISYEDAKTNADKFAKELAAECPLPDPRDIKGNTVTHLNCVDKARLQYFRARISPWLHQEMNGEYEQTKVIAEEYTDDAAKRALDANPVISALQAADAIFDSVNAGAKGQKMQSMAALAKMLSKAAQTLTNINIFWRNKTVQGSAKELAQNSEVVTQVLDVLINVPACISLFDGRSVEEDTSCMNAVANTLKVIQKTPGMDFEIVENIDAAQMLKVLGSEIEAIQNLMKLIEATDVVEGRRALFGLAGSIVKVSRDALSTAYLSQGEKEPKAGEPGYFMLSVIDNVAEPLLTIGKECYGAKYGSKEEPGQYLKCWSTVAQWGGAQGIRASVGVVGNIQMITSVSELNETVVVNRVLEEILLAGSGNWRYVYDKYNVNPFDGRDELMLAIAKQELSLLGVPVYRYWSGTVWDSKAFSINDAHSSLAYNYARVMNETPLNFESPAINLTAVNGVRGEMMLTAEVDMTKTAIKNGSLVCFSDDSNYPIDKPWSGEIKGSTVLSVTMQFARSGRRGVMCNLFSAGSIYLGSKSIPVVVDGYDNDSDGMLDQWEIDKGFDPNNPVDATEDKDNDGLTNLEEFQHNTNPKESDSDGDGFTDKQEVDASSDPLDKTKYPALSAPQNVRATPSDGKVTLSWDAVPNATSYSLCHATESITDITQCTTYANGDWWDPILSTSFDLTTLPNGELLKNGTTYYFRVIAQDAKGNSSLASAEVTATPQKATGGATGKLNDTGITTCADNYQNNLPCPQAGFAGQDAEFGRDANQATNNDADGHAGFSFTKISSTGAELPASATELSCVKDNVTGLMWEVKTDDGGLHDKDWTYSWYEPDGTKNGGNAGAQGGGSCVGSQCDTYAYVQAVNAAGWCGAKDWRMPTKRELNSIVNHNRKYPAIDPVYFPNTLSQCYWSSSPNIHNNDLVWCLGFDDGSDRVSNKAGSPRLRLVRAIH